MPESWDLKLDWATRETEVVRYDVDAFAESASYEAVPIGNAKRTKGVRRYRLRFNNQPDPILTVTIGAVLHQVRSALDHLIVANVPKKRANSAAFPVFTISPFDANGRLLPDDNGALWKTLTTGLPPLLAEQVKQLQPFQGPPPATLAFCQEHGLDPVELQGLYLLSRYENRDKHRELVKLAIGLEHTKVTYRATNCQPYVQEMHDRFLTDGGDLPTVQLDTLPPGATVTVEVKGQVRIALQVGDKGVAGLPGSLQKLVDHGREIVSAFDNLLAGKPAVAQPANPTTTGEETKDRASPGAPDPAASSDPLAGQDVGGADTVGHLDPR